MSEAISNSHKCSPFFTALTSKESEIIQGGKLTPTNQPYEYPSNTKFGPTLNVDASPTTNIVVGLGGPAFQLNNESDNNKNSGGEGISYS